MPLVHNKYHGSAPADAIYCGRGSKYGNPFVIGKDGDRDEVCDKFESLILPDLDVRALKGKDLVCFCKPKRCHCDAILIKANKKEDVMKLRTALFDIESDGLLTSKFVDFEEGKVEIPPMSKIHILCITEFETGKKFKFVGHKEIEKGVRLLQDADMVIGHNILDYDLRAIAKIFPWFELQGKVRDTLVMVRLMFSHQKELDFRLHERGQLLSEYIGRHSLDSWGYRIGKYKGDYAKEREREAKKQGLTNPLDIHNFVWGTYTEAMGEYCENDVDVTEELWNMLLEQEYPEFPIIFEHQVAEALIRQEDNGFPFNVAEAEKLRDELYVYRDRIKEECEENFSGRFEPSKYVTYTALREDYNKIDWDTIDNPDLEDTLYEILADHPGDKKVPQMIIPKKTLRYKDASRGDRTAGHPYTPVYFKEFNPGSRQQVAERLVELGWKPEDFTETGQPQVNEITLKNASHVLPIAGSLADYFGVTKTLGQLIEGDNGWMKLVTPEGKIHHHVNPCGAVTGRCTHASPNLGQVPSISKDKEKKILMGREGGWGYECRSLFYTTSPFVMMGSDLSGIELRCLAHYMAEFDNGEYGRELLEGDIHTVNQMAAGLESRDQAKTFIYACLGCEVEVKTINGYKTYDQLKIGEQVLSINTTSMVMEYVPIEKIVTYENADLWCVTTFEGSVRVTPNHRWLMADGTYKTTENLTTSDYIVRDSTEALRVLSIENLRAKEKVWCIGTRNSNFYIKSPNQGYQGITGNTLYGAGPEKIGSIVIPFESPENQARVGKELLERFLRNMPALKKLMKNLKNEARRGWIVGLDGRRLYIRAQHAALNTLLQNAGAMIAKKWYLLFEEFMEDRGYQHSWEQDFAMMAFVHDEIQVSVREELAQIAGETSAEAASAAGDFFKFKLPVAAEYKIGKNWAETH